MPKKKEYKFVDLFAGCGGLSVGLQQAGFTPWFVNEIVEQFCNTYKFNHNLSDEHYFVGDIADLNAHIDEYKEMLSDITLVCGGPPCQGFSMANRQRILDDPRNALYKQYLIFLETVRPKFFIMENVKGMMNKIDEIKQNFTEYLGEEYQFDYALLRAQDYGVPQNRERFIMIGNRVGVSPKKIFEEIYKHKQPSFVLKDALIGLPHLVAKKEKGSKDVENAESGFTECDFTYIHNDFTISLMEIKKSQNCTTIRTGIIMNVILKYIGDYHRAQIRCTNPLRTLCRTNGETIYLRTNISNWMKLKYVKQSLHT